MIANERLEEVLSGLTDALARECPATVMDKEDSALHKTIAGAFDLAQGARDIAKDLVSVLSIDVPELGIPTGARYMSDFATTIGDIIAIPRAWTPTQRLVTLPHEWAHVFQHRRGVDAGWWPKVTSHSVLYLCSIATKDAAEYLGHVEGDAYAVTECVLQYLTGQRRPITERADNLRRHYALMNEGVIVATQTLASHYRTMDDGGVPNVTSARVTMDYLRTHAADLAGQVVL
jgi:hypothetical protein